MIIFGTALAAGLTYVWLKLTETLGLYDASQKDYDKLLGQFNDLAKTYNRTVKRSYMVFLYIGKEEEGLPVSVKLVTSGYELASSVSAPVYRLAFTEQAAYSEVLRRNKDVMCLLNRKECPRKSYNTKDEAPELYKGDNSACVPDLCSSPLPTVQVPYLDSTSKLVWSAKRALELGVIYREDGSMQINTLNLFVPMSENEKEYNVRKIYDNLNEELGEFREESWELDGKLWNQTAYDKDEPAPESVQVDSVDGAKSVTIRPSALLPDSYFKLFTTANAGIGFARSTSDEFKAAATDRPINPILGELKKIDSLPEWKTPLEAVGL